MSRRLVSGAVSGAGSDRAAIHDSVAGEIAALTNVTAAVDDELLIEDDSDGNNKKKVTAKSIADLAPQPNVQRAGRILLGTLTAYPNQGSFDSASDIQYAQVFLQSGEAISNMEVFVDDGGGGAETLRMGIYDQADPDDFQDTPNSRVAQTGNKVLTGGDNGTFVSVALTSTYNVTTTGFYWIAMIVDGTNTKFAVTAEFRADYLSKRLEAGSGSTLPASAGSLTNPLGAAAYVAAILD